MLGGGTAGHVNPLLAVAGAIRDIEPTAQVTVIGTAVGLEKDLVPEAGYELDTIEKCRSRVALTCTCCASRQNGSEKPPRCAPFLKRGMADVVAGFGGYASAPVYATAHKMGIPIAIHEQNARAGMANKLGARWADFIGTVYEGTGLKPRAGADVERVGLPLLPAIASLTKRIGDDRAAVRRESPQQLASIRTVRWCWSLADRWSAKPERAIASSAADLLAHAQIIHLTGRGKISEVRELVTASAGADVLTGHRPRIGRTR